MLINKFDNSFNPIVFKQSFYTINQHKIFLYRVEWFDSGNCSNRMFTNRCRYLAPVASRSILNFTNVHERFAGFSLQRAVSDRHLAIGTACSLIDEILNGFSGREFRLIEQQETWRTQITTVRQVYEEWRSAMEQTRQVREGIYRFLY